MEKQLPCTYIDFDMRNVTIVLCYKAANERVALAKEAAKINHEIRPQLPNWWRLHRETAKLVGLIKN